MGDWAAAFGRQEVIHAGEFMGIAPTGNKVEIRYMDFWKVVDGKIVENYVMADFPHIWRGSAKMPSKVAAGKNMMIVI